MGSSVVSISRMLGNGRSIIMGAIGGGGGGGGLFGASSMLKMTKRTSEPMTATPRRVLCHLACSISVLRRQALAFSPRTKRFAIEAIPHVSDLDCSAVMHVLYSRVGEG